MKQGQSWWVASAQWTGFVLFGLELIHQMPHITKHSNCAAMQPRAYFRHLGSDMALRLEENLRESCWSRGVWDERMESSSGHPHQYQKIHVSGGRTGHD